MAAFPTSQLSQENVLRDVHDPVTQALRTNATATIVVPGGLEVDIQHTSDSIKIGDGVNLITSTNVGGKQGLDVNIISALNLNLPTGAATEATLLNLLAELEQKTEPSNAQNIRTLTSVSDSVTVPGIIKADTDNVTVISSILPTGAATEASLGLILAELQQKTEPNNVQNIRNLDSTTDSISAPIIENLLTELVDKSLNGFSITTPDTVQLVGSSNGLTTGTKFGYVNNIRQQILATEDRESTLTYADFGTKDQRVTAITYSSPTFPGVSVQKQLTYSLVGVRYRRDSINWVVI